MHEDEAPDEVRDEVGKPGVGTAPFVWNIVSDFVHVRPRVHQDEARDEVRDEVGEPGVGTAPFVRNIVFDFVHVRRRVHQDEARDEVRDEVGEPGVGTAPFVRNIVSDFVHAHESSGAAISDPILRLPGAAAVTSLAPEGPTDSQLELAAEGIPPGGRERVRGSGFGT